MPNRYDRCYDYGTQQRIRRWLICLAIVIAVAVVVAAIVIPVVGFAVIYPIKINVEDARLNGFAFDTTQNHGGTSTTFFAYNISVALTVRNPNWAMSVKYTKPLVASFAFYDRRMYSVTVAEDGHKHPRRKTEVYLLHTDGEVPSYLVDTAEYKHQNETRVFKLEMRLSGEIRYEGHRKRTLSLSCPLRLQLAPPGPEIVVFHEVNCKPEKPQNIYF